ncbi:TolC family protein [Bacteroides graminisolvens]|uniref:Outer membrane efflux protein n=1 Tax=Bacteroides graminisolvens DSM 19988 = JCM 15093 TaxID=1121097 RepID=A0A069D5L8_9BACE|nr:TolC family protein [Bacteroides graminisolvens]GAK37566.1 outer membrane efflux protein [Bacteroides graminisolvens DSM 19988 = JCM 15093]
MRHQIIGFCLFLMVSVSGSAQQAYSLAQCKKLALENNARMKNARLEVSSARQTKEEAFTNFFPSLSASALGYNANQPLVEANLGGMPLALLKNGIVGDITVTQPLFAGGQIVNGNKLAQLGVEVSRFKQEQSEKEVLLTTEVYYWQIISLNEKLKTLAIVEQLVNSLYKDVDAAVKAGVKNRNDLLQVQLRKNSVASDRLQLENGLKLSRMLLGQYVGLKADSLSLESVSFDEPASPEKLRTDHGAALLTTPEYQLLAKNVEANRLQQKITVGKYLPTVGVGASYMYDDLMDKDNTTAMVFAKVSVPISDWWGGSHAIKKQKFQTMMAQNEQRNNSDLLLIQMQKLWNDVEESYKQVKLAEESVVTATENVRLNTNYYQAGTTTLSDLLDSQLLLQQSRNQHTDAYTQYLIKQTQYLQATGR